MLVSVARRAIALRSRPSGAWCTTRHALSEQRHREIDLDYLQIAPILRAPLTGRGWPVLSALPDTFDAMDIPSIVSGAVIGGGVGWLSSVYAAGPVARRQEAARRRVQAQDRLHEVVTSYLGRLRIVHNERQLYPEGYADLGSREQLAEDVLALLPELPIRSARRIHPILMALVGSHAVELASQRANVPADARTPAEDDAVRRKHDERRLRLGYHDGVGCKSETYHLCERDHFPPLRSEHGALAVLWLTTTHPHGYYHAQQYKTVTGLLEQMLAEARPNRRAIAAGGG